MGVFDAWGDFLCTRGIADPRPSVGDTTRTWEGLPTCPYSLWRQRRDNPSPSDDRREGCQAQKKFAEIVTTPRMLLHRFPASSLYLRPTFDIASLQIQLLIELTAQLLTSCRIMPASEFDDRGACGDPTENGARVHDFPNGMSDFLEFMYGHM